MTFLKHAGNAGLSFLSLGVLAVSLSAASQQATVYATGLMSPSKVIAIGGGSLLVTEASTTANTGRVSLILPGGQRQTLIGGLPSGPAAPDGGADGPNGLAVQGQTLYIANGQGDTLVNGPQQGTALMNPAGPSSPIYATILKVTFSSDIGSLSGGFTLQPADHYTLLDGVSVTLTDAAGEQAVVQLLAQFRPAIPDPHTIYRNSHPYGLALNSYQPDYIYVADAGMNIVRQVNVNTGQTDTLARFANTPDPVKGPPTIEAVPTSIQAYGSQLLVSLLSGVPFVSGQSRVMQVDPATGKSFEFMFYLTSTMDVAILPATTPGARPTFFSLHYSSSLGANPLPPGYVMRYDAAAGYVYVNGLHSPTSMAIDASAGKLYITDRLDGTVVVAPL